MSARRSQRAAPGFSLVELLVAMTLGLLLVSGTVAVFAGNKRSSELGSAMANLQENARFALEAVARDARMAGFQGCVDINKGRLESVASSPPTTDLRVTAARGSVVATATSWSPAPPTGFVPVASGPGVAVPGTHALALQFGGPETAGLRAQMVVAGIPSPAAPVPLDGRGAALGLVAGDFAVVANCDVGDLFRVTSTVPGPDAGTVDAAHLATTGFNAAGSLTRAYGDPLTRRQTMVMKLSSNVYYVGETGLSNGAGQPVRALYRRSLPYIASNPPVELVQGVGNLRIAFGVREPTGSLRYVAPGAAGYDPARIESLQVGLLMTSWDEIAESDDGRTYALAGQPVPAATAPTDASAHARDRRMRLAFNTTIRIRNRRNGT